MFEPPIYIQSEFSIVFPRQADIRRRANDLEDVLKKFRYSQPHVLGVPDEVQPEIPRINFTSQHGFNRISISQVSVSMVVQYDDAFNQNPNEIRNYLLDNAPRIFDLLRAINVRPYFCGLSNQVQMASTSSDAELIKHIANRFLKYGYNEATHDIEVKFTNVINRHFFSNNVIKNYRTWEIDPGQLRDILQLSRTKATEHGLQITNDFNDRYGFNEGSKHIPTKESSASIIKQALDATEQLIAYTREVSE